VEESEKTEEGEIRVGWRTPGKKAQKAEKTEQTDPSGPVGSHWRTSIKVVHRRIGADLWSELEQTARRSLQHSAELRHTDCPIERQDIRPAIHTI
jgi:hypothetical protein